MRTTKIVKLTDANLAEINEFLLGNSTTEGSYVGGSFTTHRRCVRSSYSRTCS